MCERTYVGVINRVSDFTQRGLAIFGLSPKCSGLRWIARSGANELGLAHGDPRADARAVVIVGAVLRTEGINIQDSLATQLMLAEYEADAPAGMMGTPELKSWTDELLARVPGRESWGETSINVSGETTGFRQLRAREGWTAFRGLESIWLYVQSLRQAPADLELVPINDLAPYYDGNSLLQAHIDESG